MPDAPPLVLAAGRVFHERYEVVRVLDTGGMGTVYEVVDARTRRRRALKVMLPSLAEDQGMRARFELEARVTADVQTEHIVETFDAGVDAETGAPFLVMELLRGDDLAALLRARGRFSADEVVTFLGQAAQALERTHDAGIVHRDLKPANLFLTRRDDGSPRLKILDFGIAKLVAQSTASFRTTRSVGTPLYMSPEQVRGDAAIDHRADLHALGHIGFALLVGEAYWEAEARAFDAVYPLLMKIANGCSEAASSRARARGVTLPPAFDAWFAKATAVDPRDRFDSAGELARELARAVGVASEARASADLASTLGGRRSDAPWRARSFAGFAMAAAAVAVAAAALRSRAAPVVSTDPSRPSPTVSASASADAPATPLPDMAPAAASSPPTSAPAPRPRPASPPPAPTPPRRPAPSSAPATSTTPSAAPLTSSDPSDTR
jgi:serine/threonine-protein kinase